MDTVEIKNEAEQIKYERDTLLMLILNDQEFGPDAFECAVKKLEYANRVSRLCRLQSVAVYKSKERG